MERTETLILEHLAKHGQLDPSCFRGKYAKRRLLRRVESLGCRSIEEYWKVLRSSPEEVERLTDELTVNVTKFFRDPTTYRIFERRVVPILLTKALKRRRPVLRAWSAACSSGEEAYSLAMVLSKEIEETNLDISWRITATDIDEACLAHGKRGVYPDRSVSHLRRAWMERGFDPSGEEFRVKGDLRSHVRFSRADLFSIEKPLSRFDVIFCRNALIYFPLQRQLPLFQLFHRSLAEGGFLVLGRSESLVGEARRGYEVFNARERIYRKVEDVKFDEAI